MEVKVWKRMKRIKVNVKVNNKQKEEEEGEIRKLLILKLSFDQLKISKFTNNNSTLITLKYFKFLL